MYKIGKTDKTPHKTQIRNLFLFSELSSINEKEYAQMTIGKNDNKARTM
jgi:hypothetical protein